LQLGGLNAWFFHVPLSVNPSWFSFCLDLGLFILYLFLHLFWGALFYWPLASFHQLGIRDNASTELFCDNQSNIKPVKSSHACKDKTYRNKTSLCQEEDPRNWPGSYIYSNLTSSGGFKTKPVGWANPGAQEKPPGLEKLGIILPT